MGVIGISQRLRAIMRYIVKGNDSFFMRGCWANLTKLFLVSVNRKALWSTNKSVENKTKFWFTIIDFD